MLRFQRHVLEHFSDETFDRPTFFFLVLFVTPMKVEIGYREYCDIRECEMLKFEQRNFGNVV